LKLALETRRALVMGASSGLGKAVAQALAAEGAHVAVCARNAKRVAAAAAELGAEGIVADLSAPGAAAEVVREAEKRLGQVDILCREYRRTAARPLRGTAGQGLAGGL